MAWAGADDRPAAPACSSLFLGAVRPSIAAGRSQALCSRAARVCSLSLLEPLLLAVVELGSGGARPAASSRAAWACVSLAPFGGTPLFLCRVSSPSVPFFASIARPHPLCILFIFTHVP